MSNLTDTQKDELIDKIIVWVFEQGVNKSQVKKLILLEVPELTESGTADLIQESFEKYAQINSEQNDPIEVMNDHIAKYEHIYNYFKSINHAQGANKALQAKEKLLNILKDNNKFTYKKSEKVTIVNSTPVEYDLDKLTPEEQDRLKYLLQLASD